MVCQDVGNPIWYAEVKEDPKWLTDVRTYVRTTNKPGVIDFRVVKVEMSISLVRVEGWLLVFFSLPHTHKHTLLLEMLSFQWSRAWAKSETTYLTVVTKTQHRVQLSHQDNGTQDFHQIIESSGYCTSHHKDWVFHVLRSGFLLYSLMERNLSHSFSFWEERTHQRCLLSLFYRSKLSVD